MRRTTATLLLTAVALVPAATASAQPEDAAATEQVVLSGDLVVPRGTAVGEVVVVHGSATIHGVATRDVVVLDGSIVVGGQVRGELIALDGDVRLLATAQVAGGVVASGDVTQADGAQVDGVVRSGVRASLAAPAEALGSLLAPASIAVSTLLALLLLFLLAPRGAERVAHAARSAPVASAAWGLALVVAVPMLSILAAASVLGLPLGLSLLLALALLWLVGHAWAAWIVGRILAREPRPRVAALLAGWAITAAVGLVPLLTIAWWIVGAIVGLGAMTVASWRARGSSKHRIGAAPRGAAAATQG